MPARRLVRGVAPSPTGFPSSYGTCRPRLYLKSAAKKSTQRWLRPNSHFSIFFCFLRLARAVLFIGGPIRRYTTYIYRARRTRKGKPGRRNAARPLRESTKDVYQACSCFFGGPGGSSGGERRAQDPPQRRQVDGYPRAYGLAGPKARTLF